MKMTCSWHAIALPKPRMAAVRKLAKRALELAGLNPAAPWDVNLVFLDDRDMAAANKECLDHEGTTDVITLCFLDDETSLFPGDIGIELLICADVALREGTRRADSSYARELALYLTHGFLHCAGCDDLDAVARRKMRRREREILKQLAAEFDFAAVFAGKNV